LALAVFDNNPLGRFVADGFVQDGNSGFTCQEAGTSSTFCDVTTALGTTRTGNYAIAVTGADSVSAPSPAVSVCFSPAAGCSRCGGATVSVHDRFDEG
jgi:hypothetical protein